MNSLKEIQNLELLKNKINQINLDTVDEITCRRIESIAADIKNKCQDPKAEPFFKMITSLAKYIGSNKACADSESLPLLKALCPALDSFLKTGDDNRRKKILSSQIEKYRILRERILNTPVISQDDLDELKAAILAIDWEISETTLSNSTKIIEKLLTRLNSNKIYYAFLKIINSLIGYIGSRKAESHIDSIPFLNSVFEDFKNLIETPAMGYEDKKNLIEKNIKKFQDFKTKISAAEQPAHDYMKGPERKKPAEEYPDDDFDTIEPALSRFGESSASRGTGSDTLVTLAKEDETPVVLKAETKESQPDQTSAQNIMDDLFSVKESPADELLDAIHLANVHGDNPAQAMKMLDQTENIPSSGSVQNLTPTDKDNVPIPEIENRLDEFFNLERKQQPVMENEQNESRASASVQENEAADSIADTQGYVEEEILPASDMEIEGISTFQEDGEYLDQIAEQISENLKTLNRLQEFFSRLNDKTDISDSRDFKSAHKDIDAFEEKYEHDPEKACLIKIVKTSLNFIETLDQPFDTPGKNLSEKAAGNDAAEKNQQDKKAKGLFDGVRGIFSKK